MIFPSGWSATPFAPLHVPTEVVIVPSIPKLMSREPSGRYRASARELGPRPATTILPSGWSASDLASDDDPIGVVTTPSRPKAGSILPSGCNVTPYAHAVSPIAVRTTPADPKDASSAPFGSKRTSVKTSATDRLGSWL